MQDSTKGTIRSDLNNEEWKHNDKGETILEYLTYGPRRLFSDELSIEEFYCPMRYEHNFIDRRTTEACECMTINSGCSKIKECEAYNEQKRLQENFKDVRWDFPEKTQNKEELSKVILIKKGAIILPRG